MREYLKPVPGVEDLTDSIRKNPALIGAAATAARAVAPYAIDAAKKKFEEKQQEAAQAEKDLRLAMVALGLQSLP